MNAMKMILVVALGLFFGVASAPGAWSLVDDFEGLSVGDLDGQMAANGSEWLTYAWPTKDNYLENITTIDVVDFGGNKVMQINENAQRYATAQVNLTTAIAENSVGTLYFRAYMNSDPAYASTTTQYYAGGYDGIGGQADMKTGGMLGRYEDPPFYFRIEGGNQGPYISGGSAGQWYELWLVFNMGSGTGTYKVYVAGPGFTGVQEMDPGDWTLKTYDSPSGIAAMLFTKAISGTTNKHYFDDLYVDVSGANLTSAPEPASLVLLGLGGLWLRRKK